LFFYANERNGPIHIHCRKAEMECKYWLNQDDFDIIESYSYSLNNRDKREIRKIIFDNFEYIEEQWEEFQRSRNA
jgi:hypothetical protein